MRCNCSALVTGSHFHEHSCSISQSGAGKPLDPLSFDEPDWLAGKPWGGYNEDLYQDADDIPLLTDIIIKN